MTIIITLILLKFNLLEFITKSIFKIIGFTLLTLLLFKSYFFNLFITYIDIGERDTLLISNKILIEKIDHKSANQDLNLEVIADIALDITNEELSFSTQHASQNPNESIKIHRANCIGYSAMFNSITNYLITKNKLEDEILAAHKIGKLELLGVDIHKYFSSPFLKDHDFNEIINNKTGEKIVLDPSLSDYLGIDRITCRNLHKLQ